MNKFIKYPLVLIIVAGFCAGLIAITYYYTDPILTKRQEQQINDSLKLIYPDAKSHKVLFEKENLANYSDIEGVFEVTMSDGSLRFVYQTSNIGKNGPIVSLIAFNKNKIENLINVSHSETPGIGTRIDDKKYLESIIGQNVKDVQVDGISGATYSSSALRKSVESATKHYIAEVLK